jgi:hypothetical protein
MNMELVGTNDAFEAMQASKFIVVDHWRVKIKDVSRHFCIQGSWVRDMFLGLDAADQMSIVKEIVHFGLKLVQGRLFRLSVFRITRLRPILLLL